MDGMVGRQVASLGENFQTHRWFTKFFQCYSQFMNEIFPGFSTHCFGVVQGWRCSWSKKLTAEVLRNSSAVQCGYDIHNCNCELNESILKIKPFPWLLRIHDANLQPNTDAIQTPDCMFSLQKCKEKPRLKATWVPPLFEIQYLIFNIEYLYSSI